MSNVLTVPAPLDEIVQHFDTREEPFNEFTIGGEHKAARSALIEPSDAENLGAWAEVLAFALASGQHENPWNCYFGPMGSGVTADGTRVYFPDISDTRPEVVTHWGGSLANPQAPLPEGAIR